MTLTYHIDFFFFFIRITGYFNNRPESHQNANCDLKCISLMFLKYFLGDKKVSSFLS